MLRSIKHAILLFILVASLCVIVGYTYLVADYFETGLDLSLQIFLESEARAYSEEFRSNPNVAFPHSGNLAVYASEADLPELVQGLVHGMNYEHSKHFYVFTDEIIPAPSPDQEGVYCILPWIRPDGKMLLFTYEMLDINFTTEHDRVFELRLYFILGVGGVLFLGMVGMSFFLFRKIVNPIGAISNWAVDLNKENLDAPIDFKYSELNDLANLFRETMRRMLAGVKREHVFLRNASHELRTPVAVMQNNLELLHKLGADEESRVQAPLRRMNNAVTNMKSIISTLLWASRENEPLLEVSLIQMDDLVGAIIEENTYLLKGKESQLLQTLSPVSVKAPEALVRIICNNIVRNAFQHSFQGKIEIELEGKTMRVMNETASGESCDRQDCFGVGLMLISQLVEKLDWNLSFQDVPGHFSVRLDMK